MIALSKPGASFPSWGLSVSATAPGPSGRAHRPAWHWSLRRLARLSTLAEHEPALFPASLPARDVAPRLRHCIFQLRGALRGKRIEPAPFVRECREALRELHAALVHREQQLAWSPPPHQATPTRSPWMQLTVLNLRDEVLRQIDLTCALLERINSTTSGRDTNTRLLRDDEPDVQRVFDTGLARRYAAVMKDERIKVLQLENRVLFTGPMKAGKTTTINAIVGSDILPTREEAMTAVPTLVKNTQGRTTPMLRLKEAERLNEFVARLREARVPPSAVSAGARASLAAIGRGEVHFVELLEGLEPIGQALTVLNDALRIAHACDLAEEMLELFAKSQDALPAVEVQFSNLGGLLEPGDLGRLVLVDSPGPNEARLSGRLVDIVNAQLDRCSALVLVNNYTVMGAKADEEMTLLVKHYLERSNRTKNIILLNKYDAASGKSRPLEQMRKDLSGEFSCISEENVFAVSSVMAAKATFADKQLRASGRIDDKALRDEFGRLAFGASYKPSAPRFDQPERWLEMVPCVWELSFFDAIPVAHNEARAPEPDEATFVSRMREASRRAASRCMESALDELTRHNRIVQAFLGVRGKLNEREIEGLKPLISALNADIAKIASAQTLVDQRLNEAFALLIADFDKSAATWIDYVDGQIKRYFEGTILDALIAKATGSVSLFDTIRTIFGLASVGEKAEVETRERALRKRPELARDAQVLYAQGKMKFDDEAQALRFQVKVNEAINTFSVDVVKNILDEQAYVMTEVQLQVNKLVETNLGATLKSAQEKLGVAFGAALALGKMDGDTFKQISLEGKSRQAEHVRGKTPAIAYRDKEGFFNWMARGVGGFLNVLGGDSKMGQQAIAIERDIIIIDKAALKNLHLQALLDFQKELKAQVRTHLDSNVRNMAFAHFKAVVEYIEKYRNVIDDNLRDHTLSVEERNALMLRVEELREVVEQLLLDAIDAEKAITSLGADA
jgi:Dynamin family